MTYGGEHYYNGGSQGCRVGTAKANAATWKHPAGHASWCAAAVPFNRHKSSGNTPMAKSQCSCPRNRLAASLRKLEAGRIGLTAEGEAA